MKHHVFIYAVVGLCLGSCFPIGTLLIDMIWNKQLAISLKSILFLHTSNPLYFVIDTIPLVVSIALGFAGLKQEKITTYLTELTANHKQALQVAQEHEQVMIHQNAQLEKTVKNSTAELHESNEELKQIIEELHAALELVTAQKRDIDAKNDNITSSIRYAKVIQQTILPTTKNLTTIFKEYFVVYRPKDIISGDFYYTKHIKEDSMALAALVDCTGHGVPGAFMSLVVANLLHEITKIKKIYTPSAILAELNRTFLKVFSRHELSIGNPIGFEVMICVWKLTDTKIPKTVLLGSSYRSFYVFRQATNELAIIKVNRVFIGIHQTNSHMAEVFDDIELELTGNDWIYMISDGFYDQPNKHRKKFGSLAIKNMLQEIGNENAHVQQKKIEHHLDEHSKGVAQRDDITLFAIQI